MPNKPTTLREEFEKEWKDSFAGGDMHDWERGQEVADWWIEKLTPHNTELLQKIEDRILFHMASNDEKAKDYPKGVNDGAIYAFKVVISLINQENETSVSHISFREDKYPRAGDLI